MKQLTSVLFAAAAAGMIGLEPAAAAKVGVTSAVNPHATGKPPGGTARTLSLGKKVVFNERIKTTREGLVQLLLLDGSAFTIGPGSEVVIDKFVYDPNTKTGEMVANVVRGAFRFVGGRLSKKKDGVTIRTPVATIGVRGGIVSGRVDGRENKGTFNFLFGDEMTVGTNCGGGGTGQCATTKRVFQNGNSVDVNTAGQLDLRRTSRQDIAAMQGALSGQPGKSGGAPKKPTNTIVVQSGVRQNNSGRPPAETAPPPRRAIKSTPVVEVETEVVRPGQANRDDTRQDISDTKPVRVRVLETDNVLTTSFGDVIYNPGSVGILGGDDPNTVYVETATAANGRLRIVRNGKTASLPYVESSSPVTAGGGASEFTVTDGIGPDGESVLGSGFVTQGGNFVFYQLFPENLDNNGNGLGTPNLDEGIIIIGGTPVPSFDASATGGTLHLYEMGRDLRQGISVPFTMNTIFSDYSRIKSTAYMLREQTSGTIGVYPNDASSRTVTLQGNLMIDGTGSGQKSFALLHAGFLYDDGSGAGPKIETANRGGFRRAANEKPVSFSGQVASVKGPEGNHFFGSSNIDNFVLGTEPDNKESFHYSFAGGGTLAGTQDNHFGTYHALNRSSDVAPSAQGTRTARTLTGFANGFREAPVWDAVNPGPTAVRSLINGGGMEIIFNPNRNTMWAKMVLGSDPSVGSNDALVSGYTLAFGSDPAGQPTGTSGAAFIDDDTYGAHFNRNSTAVHFNSYSDLNYPHSVEENPKTYIFGSELVEVTGFLPSGVTFCDCKFLEWGYWGGRLKYDNPDNPGTDRRDYFHLGTWVAGDVITNLTPFTGVATYNGHAIGNVAKVVGSEVHRYLAAGNFSMTFDFGSRLGNATISDFDNKTFSAPYLVMSTTPGMTHNYQGALTNASVTSSGLLTGAFVNGPASGTTPAGTIGDFTYSESGYAAVGIVAGQQ